MSLIQTLNFAPPRLDFEVQQADDVSIDFQAVDDEDNPIDLSASNHNPVMSVKRHSGEPPILSLTFAPIDMTVGKFTMSADRALLKDISGSWLYDLEIELPGPNREQRTVSAGGFYIHPQITNLP